MESISSTELTWTLKESDFPSDPLFIETLSGSYLSSINAFPIKVSDGDLWLAISDPNQPKAIQAIEMLTGLNVCCFDCDVQLINQKIAELYRNQSPQQKKKDSDEGEIVDLVNQIMNEAIAFNASDIHIEPKENLVLIRFRTNGDLYSVKNSHVDQLSGMSARIKILSNLDVAERRLPQDGSFTHTHQSGEKVDIRVSIVPSSLGETIVMRLLRQPSNPPTLESLGFLADQQKLLLKASGLQQGLILFSGPTGSGKTTSLFSLLNVIQQRNLKIITAEDPVEYRILGAQQIQIKPSIGLTFPHVLRSILRQDPDVILIGELRDEETASIAIQAALTGHLVLATLHAPDALSAIVRLRNLGISDDLIASTLKLSVAQRLVKKIDNNTRSARTVIAELIPIDDRLRSAISEGLPLAELDECCNSDRFNDIAQLLKDQNTISAETSRNTNASL